MTLIERAGDFYAALLREKKVHDPAVLNFRTFMVQHFSQDGLRLANEIDRKRKEGNAEAKQALAPNVDAGKKKFRRFDHPHKGMGQTAFQGGLGRIRGTLRQQIVEVQEDDQEQVEVQPTISLPSAATPVVSTTAVSAKPAVVGGSILTKAAQEQIAEMQPSAVAKNFDMKMVRQWMDDQGIKYKADGSDRQVAATLVNHLKRKAE
jgi:hypothetical protein